MPLLDFLAADNRNGYKIVRADEGRIVEDEVTARGAKRRDVRRGGRFALSGEPTSREIDSSILCAVARGLVPGP